MIDPVDRSCKRNCYECVFQYKRDHGKVLYCVLKNFAILNPEIGCSRQMMKSEFKSNNIKYITPEELRAYTEVNIQEMKDSGVKNPVDDKFDI